MLLINAVKDVAAALGDLISATKNASGKSAHDPAMAHLKDSAKVSGKLKLQDDLNRSGNYKIYIEWNAILSENCTLLHAKEPEKDHYLIGMGCSMFFMSYPANTKLF